MRTPVLSSRAGSRLALAAAALAALSLTPSIPVGALEPPPAAPAAAAAAAPAPAPRLRSQSLDLQPPDGKWLTDANGRKYFLRTFPKVEGSYLRVDKTHVRTSWGITLEVAKETDKLFYYKLYQNDSQPAPRSARPAEPTKDELAAAAATYRVDVPESDRLRFVPFGKGLPTSGQWRNGFDIADMNGDGHLDIVSGPARKSLSPPAIFLGDGKGGWRIWREAKYPRLPYDYGNAAVGDFNGDGHPDVALAMHLRGLQVLLGDGKGGFVNASEGLDFQVPGRGNDVPGFSSQAIAVADWNGDGRPDVIALGEGPTLAFQGSRVQSPGASHAFGIAVYLNQGNGKWERKDQGTGPGNLFGDQLTLGDFKGDHRVGLATSTSVMGRKDLVDLHDDHGGWEAVPVDAIRPAAYVNAVRAADFDRDGRADLAMGYTNFELNVWRSGIDVIFSRPDGKWERRSLFNEESKVGVTALGSGDVDGDGNLDLVALTGDGRTLVFLGDGKGSFTREKTSPPPFGGCRGYHVQLADLDGDKVDEVVSSFAGEPSGMLPEALKGAVASGCPSGGGITAWKLTRATGGKLP